MKYLDKSFSVSPGASDAYRDNWDRIFGKKQSQRERYLALTEQLAEAKKNQAAGLRCELEALWAEMSPEERKGLKKP